MSHLGTRRRRVVTAAAMGLAASALACAGVVAQERGSRTSPFGTLDGGFRTTSPPAARMGPDDGSGSGTGAATAPTPKAEVPKADAPPEPVVAPSPHEAPAQVVAPTAGQVGTVPSFTSPEPATEAVAAPVGSGGVLLPGAVGTSPAWTPTPVAAAPDDGAVRRLVDRARGFLDRGDVLGARAFLEGPAAAGDGEASFRLAQTYDPVMLSEWRVVGATGDARRARELYDAAARAGYVDVAKDATRNAP